MRPELTAERRHTGNLLPGNLIDPLHEIIGYASVLKGEAQIMSPNDIQGFVRNIISGAETLNQRFENFLLLSLIQSDSLIISPPETIALHEALADLAGQTARRHLRANSLRMTREPVTVAVSSQLLFKAVSKTVDNASRYSTTSQPIDISLSATPTEFSVNLRDHGVGMRARARANSTRNRRFHQRFRASGFPATNRSPRRKVAPRKSARTRRHRHFDGPSLLGHSAGNHPLINRSTVGLGIANSYPD